MAHNQNMHNIRYDNDKWDQAKAKAHSKGRYLNAEIGDFLDSYIDDGDGPPTRKQLRIAQSNRQKPARRTK